MSSYYCVGESSLRGYKGVPAGSWVSVTASAGSDGTGSAQEGLVFKSSATTNGNDTSGKE